MLYWPLSLYSHYVTRPVLRINRVSKRMAELDFSWRCEENRTDELGTLAHSLNEMSQKLSASMTDLKCANEKLQADIERERALEQAQLDFFSAVSHELKTPITVIKGQTEGMILNVGDYQDRNKYLGALSGNHQYNGKYGTGNSHGFPYEIVKKLSLKKKLFNFRIFSKEIHCLKI